MNEIAPQRLIDACEAVWRMWGSTDPKAPAEFHRDFTAIEAREACDMIIRMGYTPDDARRAAA